MKQYRFFDLIMAVFVTVLVVSNIASSAKIVDWGVNLFGVPMAFDAGTLMFPIAYIFGDVLTEVYGYKRSRRVIWKSRRVCANLISIRASISVIFRMSTALGELFFITPISDLNR